MRLIFMFLGAAQGILAALLFGRPPLERRGYRWALALVLSISGLGWLWFGVRDLLGAEAARAGTWAAASWIEGQLIEQGALLGLARGGELQVLAPAASAASSTRLTEIGMAESVAPESAEIDLRLYEGQALVVRGRDGGGWVYEAEIVEQGGPLLTALVRSVYRSGP